MSDKNNNRNNHRTRTLNRVLNGLNKNDYSKRFETLEKYNELMTSNPWFKPNRKTSGVLMGADFEVSQDFENHVAWLWFGCLSKIDTRPITTYSGKRHRTTVHTGAFSVDRYEPIACYRYVEELLELLYENAVFGYDNLVCFHNGGKYDVQLLLNYPCFKELVIDKRLMGSKTRITRIAIDLYGKQITFIDSLNILGASIKQVGNEIGLPKLDYDYTACNTMDETPTEEQIEYCYRDVEIMLKGVCNQVSKFEWIKTLDDMPLTQAGIARQMITNRKATNGCPVTPKQSQEFRQLCNYMTPKTHEEVIAMTSSFYGGITFCNPHCLGKYYNHVWGDDFKSSYPATMLRRHFPMSKFGFREVTNVDISVYTHDIMEQTPKLLNMEEDKLECLPHYYNHDSEYLFFIAKIEFTNVRPKDINGNILPWVSRNQGKNPTKEVPNCTAKPFSDEPLYIENNVGFCDAMTAWFCDVDLINFLKCYDVDSWKILALYQSRVTPTVEKNGVTYRNGAIPSNISTSVNWAGMRKDGFGLLAKGEEIYNVKYHITDDENRVCSDNKLLAKQYKAQSKVPLNSMFGVLCTRLKFADLSLDEQNEIVATPVSKESVFDEMDKRKNTNGNTQDFYLGLYVTAYSRASLINYWAMISKADGTFIACDTDSLYYTCPTDMHKRWEAIANEFTSKEYIEKWGLPENPCNFGLFEMEHEDMELCSNGKKFYIMREVENGVETITTKIAGYPKAHSTTDDNPIIYDYHTSGLTFDEWINAGGFPMYMLFEECLLFNLRPNRVNVGKDVTKRAKGKFPIYSHYTLESNPWGKNGFIPPRILEYEGLEVDSNENITSAIKNYWEQNYLEYYKVEPKHRTYLFNDEYEPLIASPYFKLCTEVVKNNTIKPYDEEDAFETYRDIYVDCDDCDDYNYYLDYTGVSYNE